jgi:hypothetical protein
VILFESAEICSSTSIRYAAGDPQWEMRFDQVPLGIVDETRIAKGLIRPSNASRREVSSTMSSVAREGAAVRRA